MISSISESGIIGEETITVAQNICMWYDGTLRPWKGHSAKCHWYFDGQVWWHGRT